MSDHGAYEPDDWTEASILTVPKIPFYTGDDYTNDYRRQNGIASQSNGIHPPVGSAARDMSKDYRNAERASKLASQTHGIGRGQQAPTLHLSATNGINHQAGGLQERYTRSPVFPVGNVAESAFKRGEPATIKYTLSRTWEQLLPNLGGRDAYTWSINSLNQISRETGAFIGGLEVDATTLQIWGPTAQAEHARVALGVLEKQMRRDRQEGKRGDNRWSKVNALDGRAEHRDERQARAEELLREQRNLVASTNCDFEFWLLWPTEDIPYNTIAPSARDELERHHRCAIGYEENLGYVRIMGNSQTGVIATKNRMIGLVKEKVAEMNSVIRANLLTPPNDEARQDRVTLVSLAKNMLPTPKLHGIPLDEDLIAVEKKSRSRTIKGNRERVSDSIVQCLNGLSLSKKHVRLRVNMGRLGFKRYQLPQQGRDSYNFDEFTKMVRNERTAFELQGLPCGPATDELVDKCASLDLFQEPNEIFALEFDFRGPDATTLLRFETEYRLNSKNETEVSSARWLEPRTGLGDRKLEVNMVEFGKLDYQMVLDAISTNENEKTEKERLFFENNITCKPSSGGPKAKSTRRAVFPTGNAALLQVAELTITEYNVKDTDGKFRVIRKDVYPQTEYGSGPEAVTSTLSAVYFYPEWDNLLGEYAYLPVGSHVTWDPYLSTFFRDRDLQTSYGGFRKFMQEIETIQQALSQDSFKNSSSGTSSADDLLPDIDLTPKAAEKQAGQTAAECSNGDTPAAEDLPNDNDMTPRRLGRVAGRNKATNEGRGWGASARMGSAAGGATDKKNNDDEKLI